VDALLLVVVMVSSTATAQRAVHDHHNVCKTLSQCRQCPHQINVQVAETLDRYSNELDICVGVGHHPPKAAVSTPRHHLLMSVNIPGYRKQLGSILLDTLMPGQAKEWMVRKTEHAANCWVENVAQKLFILCLKSLNLDDNQHRCLPSGCQHMIAVQRPTSLLLDKQMSPMQ
jgi:hypothetical protein